MDDDAHCAFCDIVRGTAPAYTVFENDFVCSFLDILPSRRGHVLIVPKQHYKLLSDLPDDVAREMGSALARVSQAVIAALGHPAFTVTLNQIYAQVVPHVHFHIVPAPDYSKPSSASTNNIFVHREELDEDDALVLTKEIKAKL